MSSFASALGSTTAAARFVYAFARDGVLPPGLARLSDRTREPVAAIGAVVAFTLALTLILHLVATDDALNVYLYLATIGVLALLVVYLFTSAGAIRFLMRTGRARATEVLIPALGVVYLGYVLYKQTYPVPDAPYNLFPYIAAGWLLVGAVLILARPAMARRIGERLAAEVGGANPVTR